MRRLARPQPGMTRFTRRVLSAVRRIPPGHVATYGDIAALAGRAGAWRAVGRIMRDSRAPGVPYHRVVAAGGRLGGYSDRLVKIHLLVSEGLVVAGGRIRHFGSVRWDGRASAGSERAEAFARRATRGDGERGRHVDARATRRQAHSSKDSRSTRGRRNGR